MAITIKAQAKQLLRATKALLANKALPAALKDDLDKVELALRRTWDDLEAESADDEKPEEKPADKPADKEPEAKAAPAEEAAVALVGDLVELVEADASKGTIPVKIIQPGWGSSGYYPPDILKRDGGKIFADGLHMYWNHATEKQESERPEGDLRDLAGVLVGGAQWMDAGPAGPGLYASAKVFEQYRPALKELAPHIGLSIRAMGRAQEGEADGKRGPVITALTAARSVDFVTKAGAGGQILQLFEAARHMPSEQERKEMQELDEAKKANAALADENARLKEALLLREATDFVVQTLAGFEMHEVTRKRIAEQLIRQMPIKDAALDKEAYKAMIEEAAKAETDYLAAVSKPGEIRGLGAPAPKTAPTGALKESFKYMYLKLGMAADQADRLAELAAQGR